MAWRLDSSLALAKWRADERGRTSEELPSVGLAG